MRSDGGAGMKYVICCWCISEDGGIGMEYAIYFLRAWDNSDVVWSTLFTCALRGSMMMVYGVSCLRRIWEDGGPGKESVVYFLHILEDRDTFMYYVWRSDVNIDAGTEHVVCACVSGRKTLQLWSIVFGV